MSDELTMNDDMNHDDMGGEEATNDDAEGNGVPADDQDDEAGAEEGDM